MSNALIMYGKVERAHVTVPSRTNYRSGVEVHIELIHRIANKVLVTITDLRLGLGLPDRNPYPHAHQVYAASPGHSMMLFYW